MSSTQRYIVPFSLLALLSLFLFSLLLLPTMVRAGERDVIFDSTVTIDLASDDLTIYGNGAEVESITVAADTITVTMPVGAFFNVRSAAKKNLSVSGVTATNTCTASGNVYEMNNPSGSTVTVTITVLTTSCTSASGGGGGGTSGGGGGGGGGGGASSGSSATTQTTTTTAAPKTIQQQIADTLAKVAVIQAQLKSLPPSAAVSAPPGAAVSAVAKLARTLAPGAVATEVKTIQQILNTDPATRVSSVGAGSPGKETTTLGPATTKAVQKFQEKYGITKAGEPGYGNIGPKTRAKLSEVGALLSGTTAPAAPAPSAPSAPSVSPSAGVITSSPSVGTVSAQVRSVQQILNADPDTRVAATGPGSPGSETSYLGPATVKAVQKFQEKYGITKAGEPGYGNIGPKTRAKLNEVSSGVSAPAAPAPATQSVPTTVNTTDIESKIADTLAKIKILQEQIKTVQ